MFPAFSSSGVLLPEADDNGAKRGSILALFLAVLWRKTQQHSVTAGEAVPEFHRSSLFASHD